MNITIIHNARFFGGGERHTAGLAIALSAAGHFVRIIDCGVGVYASWDPNADNISVVTEGSIADSRNVIACGLRFARYPSELAVIISGGLQGFTLAAEAGIALSYRKVIRIEHGCVDPIESYARRLWLGFIPGLNCMANIARFRRFARSILIPNVVAVSHASKNRLVEHGYMRPSGVRVVHNGTDCRARAPRTRADIRNSLGVPADATLFICCGRLSHEKGVDVAIAAFAACRARRGSIDKLLIVGSGPLESHLKNTAVESGAGGDVIFAGFQTDVASHLNASDCLVLPSLSESFPLTLLEAMHFGCYPIPSAVGGVPEMFPPGVPHRLVAPGDAAQLREAMDRYLGMPAPEREACKATLIAHVSANFDERSQYGKLTERLVAP